MGSERIPEPDKILEVLRLVPIVECRFKLDGGAMFSIIPKPLWERNHRADESNRIALVARCWLIETGERLILVDTGLGNKFSEKKRRIYAVEHEHGTLRGAIHAAGYEPDGVTDVVITHLHFDHAGGLTRVNDEGAIVPTFPQAVHHIQADNWNWAQSPSLLDRGSYSREDFAVLERSEGPRLAIHSGEGELVAGVEMMVCRGHTFGMQLPIVRLGNHTVMFVADLIPTRTHVRPTYSMGYDLFPLDNLKEKQAVLERAVRHDWILGLEHDPEVGFVRVERRNQGYHALPCEVPRA